MKEKKCFERIQSACFEEIYFKKESFIMQIVKTLLIRNFRSGRNVKEKHVSSFNFALTTHYF
jgi:hypothetical protein